MLVIGTVAAGGMSASADNYDYLIEVEDITFGETEKVTVTAPYEGASFYVFLEVPNGERWMEIDWPLPENIISGEEFEISGLNAGTYRMALETYDGKWHLRNQFEVKKAVPDIDFTIGSKNAGSHDIIPFSVSVSGNFEGSRPDESCTGQLLFYNMTKGNTIASVPRTSMETLSAEFEASLFDRVTRIKGGYTGDSNHEPCYDYRILVVRPSEGTNILASASDISETDNEIITVSAAEDRQGDTVNITIRDVQDTAVFSGSAVFEETIGGKAYAYCTADKLPAGEYYAEAVCGNDTDYVAFTVTRPVRISDYDELKAFAHRVNNGENCLSAFLTNDIDASSSAQENDWTPIGKDEEHSYFGTFDGDGHIIAGLTYNSSADYAGLFGYVGAKEEGGVTTKGTVKNVGLVGGTITGKQCVGGVAGKNYGGKVTCCYNTGDVSGNNVVGGIVGQNVVKGSVSNCYNTGSVTATDDSACAGGLVGHIAGGTSVSNCYNTGSVTAPGKYTDFGGIIGRVFNVSLVKNCYFDSDRVRDIYAIGYSQNSTQIDVAGLTTAQMTGDDALSDSNMKFVFSTPDENPWLTKADGGEEAGGHYWYYPHLKGFAYDTTSAAEDWPAKAEVSVTLSKYSFGYDGERHMPTVTSVISGKTLEAGADYAVSYYKKTGEDWSTNTVTPVDAGDYKAVITFLKEVVAGEGVASVPDESHAPIEKEFTIDRVDVTITAKSENYTYDGRAHSNSGYDVKGLVENDAITAVVTGSITFPSESPVTNKITDYSFTTGNPENYNVTKVNGELTMANASKEITITSASGSWTYDGSSHSDNAVEVTDGTLFDGDELAAEATGSVTDVADTAAGNNAIAPGYKIMHGTEDVTANYVITTVNGTLTIKQAVPETKATAEDIDYGQKAVITFTAPEGATGKVTFYLDAADTGVTKAIENGQAVCEFENLRIGTHSVEAVYTGDGNYTSGETATAKFEVRPVGCPLTISYQYADGTEVAKTYSDSVEIFTDYSVASPEITGYTPDIPKVEGTMESIDGTEVKVTYKANDYEVTFNADGSEYKKETVTFGTEIPEPEAPAKENYDFAGWDAEIPAAMPAENLTFNALFVPVEYTAAFVDENGKTVKEVSYTVETEKLDEPAVPTKEGYEGKWEEYKLAAGGITVKPVYTEIPAEEASDEPAAPVAVEGNRSANLGYKENQTFTADVTDIPEGAEIHWFVNGEDVGTGSEYTVVGPKEDYTIQAKVIDKDGNVLSEGAEQSITVKNSFLDKVMFFFAYLLKIVLTPVWYLEGVI